MAGRRAPGIAGQVARACGRLQRIEQVEPAARVGAEMAHGVVGVAAHRCRSTGIAGCRTRRSTTGRAAQAMTVADGVEDLPGLVERGLGVGALVRRRDVGRVGEQAPRPRAHRAAVGALERSDTLLAHAARRLRAARAERTCRPACPAPRLRMRLAFQAVGRLRARRRRAVRGRWSGVRARVGLLHRVGLEDVEQELLHRLRVLGFASGRRLAWARASCACRIDTPRRREPPRRWRTQGPPEADAGARTSSSVGDAVGPGLNRLAPRGGAVSPASARRPRVTIGGVLLSAFSTIVSRSPASRCVSFVGVLPRARAIASVNTCWLGSQRHAPRGCASSSAARESRARRYGRCPHSST